MLTAEVRIGSGNVVDTLTEYGLVYLDSDKVVGPKSKGFDSTSYPEEEGEHIIPKTVDAPFDYKVKFFVDPGVPSGGTEALNTANQKIKRFNEALFDYVLDPGGVETGVKQYKKVEFYNNYKRHLIVGYPQEIAEATDYWHDTANQLNDVVVVEWTIRVTKPSECNFYAAESPSV